MATRNEQLLAWLTRIAEVAEFITCESDVDDCLWPAYPMSPLADRTLSPTRLLQVLGYNPNQVFYKERIPLARGKGLEPDFVIRVRGEAVLVIEDKSPSARVEDWLGQVRDYFLKVDAPLGMIFNTQQALLLINTRLPELSEYSDLESQYVLQASIEALPKMQHLLSYLVAPSSRSDMLAVAKRLAEQKLAQIKREKDRKRKAGQQAKRLASIVERVSQIKTDPPDYLLAAIVAADEQLKQIRNVKPGEIRNAWLGRSGELQQDGGVRVRGEHRGHTFEGCFNPSTGMVLFGDGPPHKPSPAALCAIHTVDPKYMSVNGRTWWKYYDDESQEWLPLKMLAPTGDRQG